MPRTHQLQDEADDLFAGVSEMGELMRTLDWSETPIGPVEDWSPTLRMMVKLILANRFPLLLWWGPQFIQIYNDAYIPVLGDKHPHRALGRPFSECWSEVFSVVGPLAQVPFEGGPPTWMEDIPLEVNRFGFMEETHFTIAYSPVPDDTTASGIGGVLATVHEISEKVVGERRVRVLRDLSAKPVDAKTPEQACTVAAETLAGYPKDVPFAMVYLLDPVSNRALLAGKAGLEHDGGWLCPESIDLNGTEAAWPLALSRDREEIVVVDELAKRFRSIPKGPWSDPSDSAAVVPIKSADRLGFAGFLIAGISPRLRFDDSYRGFLELASGQISSAIATARAYEEERRRNDALAEIDRAKTVFFTNISHEFRTPLSLIIEPVEDLLSEGAEIQEPAARQRLEAVHRNSLRLLKLVNTLLDFSRIEAGRMDAAYQSVDLAKLTAEFASVFRSAIERAGMQLTIDCPPLPEPVFVDRDMWEKIVLNLLSNALKFTFEGGINVSLRAGDSVAQMTVSDTGSGIPAEEIPRLFERFHRVKNVRARSIEGSGIGLALVQDLVRLHGGSVRVESEPGNGSKFIVSIPLGSTHLHAAQVRSVPAGDSTTTADAYVTEANQWLRKNAQDEQLNPNWRYDSPAADQGAAAAAGRELILLADDNPDIRDYILSLLRTEFEVYTVADGDAAIEAAKRLRPTLVLTDVMMPGTDGFGVLQAIRKDPRLNSTAVILLSARAGEEARVEGLRAGADDYLVKPFSARELIARVRSQQALSRFRRESERQVRESEERLSAWVNASSDVIYEMSADWSEMSRLNGGSQAGTRAPDRNWLEKYIHPDDRELVLAAIREAIRTRSVFELEHRILRADGAVGWTSSRAVPLLNAKGEITAWFGAASDLTLKKQAEQAMLRSEKLASVGRMAATMAHEINNPLEAITTCFSL